MSRLGQLPRPATSQPKSPVATTTAPGHLWPASTSARPRKFRPATSVQRSKRVRGRRDQPDSNSKLSPLPPTPMFKLVWAAILEVATRLHERTRQCRQIIERARRQIESFYRVLHPAAAMLPDRRAPANYQLRSIVGDPQNRRYPPSFRSARTGRLHQGCRVGLQVDPEDSGRVATSVLPEDTESEQQRFGGRGDRFAKGVRSRGRRNLDVSRLIKRTDEQAVCRRIRWEIELRYHGASRHGHYKPMK